MNTLSAPTHQAGGAEPANPGSSSVMVQIPDGGDQPQIRRVPPHLKTNKDHLDAYIPVIVSMGPYYHGNPQCRRAEIFKQESLDAFVSESHNGEDKSFFYGKILERITEIRGLYEEVEFVDQALAWLILHDACFFIYYMQMQQARVDGSSSTKLKLFNSYFGQGAIKFITRDLLLMENQIPLSMVKFLLCLQSDRGESIFSDLLQSTVLADGQHCRLFNADGGDDWQGRDFSEENNSFHFLEAYYSAQIKGIKAMFPNLSKHSSSLTMENVKCNNRAVTDLKAFGIYIRRSTSKEYRRKGAVSFDRNELYLPVLSISRNSFVMYCNLIAYEMSSPASTNEVISFVNFMKLLIQGSDDVKILRKAGILSCGAHTDEQVLKVFNELDTFGCDNLGNFAHVRATMERSSMKLLDRWVAELRTTYFGDPWNLILFMQSIITLWLAAIQTYFTVMQSLKKS